MTSPDVPLSGGWVNEGVVRVGDTLRPPVGSHSPFVHRLLEHLEGLRRHAALPWHRRPGSRDPHAPPGSPVEGTEILADDQIVSAAALLRGYHDAAATFPRLRAETIVHGDPDPWNVLWQGDRALALIDFDEARPGRRLADVGYFAWRASA
jgi:Phosphotransferase enzyme family